MSMDDFPAARFVAALPFDDTFLPQLLQSSFCRTQAYAQPIADFGSSYGIVLSYQAQHCVICWFYSVIYSVIRVIYSVTFRDFV